MNYYLFIYFIYLLFIYLFDYGLCYLDHWGAINSVSKCVGLLKPKPGSVGNLYPFCGPWSYLMSGPCAKWMSLARHDVALEPHKVIVGLGKAVSKEC